MNFSLSILHLHTTYYVAHNVKSTVTISSIFVAFIENMNFTFIEYNQILAAWPDIRKCRLVGQRNV